MKNSTPFVVAISLMACIFRYVCETKAAANLAETTGIDIVMVMAFINSFAFLFVLYLIVYNSQIIVKDKVYKYTIDTSKKKTSIEKVNKFINLFILVVFTCFGILYMFSYNSFWNDILSIVALGLSIISDDVSNSIGNNILKKIKKKI